MGTFQVDWYWAVIGALSAYVLGTAHAQTKLKKFADSVVQRTVTSLRPAPPTVVIQRDDDDDRDTPVQTRRRRNTRGGYDGE